MNTPSHLKSMKVQAQLDSSVSTNDLRDGDINLTPKKVELELDVPLRDHIDGPAINRGWIAYKKSIK